MPSDSFSRTSASVADNFTRANGGLGANWTTGCANSSFNNAPSITSNIVAGNAAGTYQSAFYSGTSFSSDSQFSQAIAPTGGNDANAAVSLFVNATNSQGYFGQFYNGNFRIDIYNSGGTHTGSNVVGTLASGDVLRLEVTHVGGKAYIALYQNGAPVAWRTDTSPITGGAPGIGVYGNTSRSQLSNFTGGILPDGDLGTNWKVPNGSLTISGGVVSASSIGQSLGGGGNFALWATNVFSKDQTAQVTLSSVGNGFVGPAVRLAGSGVQGNSKSTIQSGYVGLASTGTWTIYKFINNGFTSLNTGSATWNSGDVVSLSVVGTTLTMKQNGSTLGTITDSTITGGQAGFWLKGTGGISGWTCNDVFYTTTIASDNFQRASLGANWQRYYNQVAAIISSGNVGNNGVSNNDDAPLWVGSGSFNNDQWAQVTQFTATEGGTYIGTGVVFRESPYPFSDPPYGPNQTNVGYTYVSSYGTSMAATNISAWRRSLDWYQGESVFNYLVKIAGAPFQVNDVVVGGAIGDFIYGMLNGVIDLCIRDTSSSSGAPGFNDFNVYNDSGADVRMTNFAGGNFAAFNVYSVPDCRNYATFPNASRKVQGTLIYDVQTSDNPAVPGTDSRAAGAPVDSRVSPNIPQNSRTPGTFGPGE